MDADAFGPDARGTVRRTFEGYRAFVPDPLPRIIDLPTDVVVALDAATAAVNRLGGVGRLLPNPHLLVLPQLRREAVLSSRIEGTRTDLDELLLFEAGELADGAARADAQEVSNYVAALQHGLARLVDGFPLSLRLLREMHAVLMDGVRGQERRPGEFRTSPNWIGGTSLDRAVFVPPPPDELGACLADWERYLHDESMPLLVRIALAHHQFEVIHPFLDGNGRIGRLLIPLQLVHAGVLDGPSLHISAWFERHRSDYYDLLLSTTNSGDFMPWLRFVLDGVRTQAAAAEERTIRLLDLQRTLRDALLAEKQPASVVRLCDHLFIDPVVTAARVESVLAVTRPTAAKAIEVLVERGDLVEITGKDRYRVYRAPAIFDAVYGGSDA